jgi:hypothetical protein
VDGRFVGQPADGSTGRYKPASGAEETEEMNLCVARMRGQGLVEGTGGVRQGFVDSCRQKRRLARDCANLVSSAHFV